MPATMLRQGQRLRSASNVDCEVRELLGTGGQGEVYRVTLAEQEMALKWYFPASATPQQLQALDLLVKKGQPTERFLWPLDLVHMGGTTQFGYLMPLRTQQYKSIVDLMKRRIEPMPGFRQLAVAGRQLADSYFQLHVNGLCYRDISFGNVFFDPKSGDVMICDNDNVTVNGNTEGGVLGTPRFMAPEIVRGEAAPSTQTDRFSLAVFLFYLLMFHHPLEGKREADIHVLDQSAMNRIYGTEPLFIFDPNDSSNAPVKGYQDNPLVFWPLYPQFIRDLFIRAFTDGLKDPENGRILENEWRAAMVQLHDAILYCPSCDSQNFYDLDALKKNNGNPLPCWSCQQQVRLPYRIRIENNVLMLNRDTQLYPHHIDRTRKWDFARPIAQMNQHPQDKNRWGLRNLSETRWVLTRPDGVRQDVEHGQNAPIAKGVKINFGGLEGEVRY